MHGVAGSSPVASTILGYKLLTVFISTKWYRDVAIIALLRLFFYWLFASASNLNY